MRMGGLIVAKRQSSVRESRYYTGVRGSFKRDMVPGVVAVGASGAATGLAERGSRRGRSRATGGDASARLRG
jgi:hypothetical protein